MDHVAIMEGVCEGLPRSGCFGDRRERIATAALQGLLAADFDYSTSALAERAVRYADALIAALDKPVKP